MHAACLRCQRHKPREVIGRRALDPDDIPVLSRPDHDRGEVCDIGRRQRPEKLLGCMARPLSPEVDLDPVRRSSVRAKPAGGSRRHEVDPHEGSIIADARTGSARSSMPTPAQDGNTDWKAASAAMCPQGTSIRMMRLFMIVPPVLLCPAYDRIDFGPHVGRLCEAQRGSGSVRIPRRVDLAVLRPFRCEFLTSPLPHPPAIPMPTAAQPCAPR